ncbi:MAG TPA: 3-isopropylmalate dehydratase small subunit [Cytophagales bacterium]|nr:3-isopropylmalate dehydratase small subunit [Cytophagales bacterium]HAA18488.1 3-isopropylmalate dehydratase small subunit [Cytophagales bacterium]
MEKINTILSTGIPLPVEDIDTDQIIPARFLKATTREGFGEKLFHDWRFDPEGQPNPEFVLNQTKYTGSVLVAGNNFGCGSSREHAVWALYDYGFRVVIAPQFADIFKNNALNNGLLPVALPTEVVAKLQATIEENPAVQFKVDLESQSVWLDGQQIGEFDVNAYKKHCLQNGFDDTDFLLSILDEVETFEKTHITF